VIDELLSAAPGCCTIAVLVALVVGLVPALFPYWRENRAWRAFAAQHGLTLQGTHPSISLEGKWRGHDVALNVHRTHAHHRAAHLSQHFTLTLVPSIHDLFVGPPVILEQRGADLGGQHFTTGDAAFDARFRVKASDVAAARAWLDDRRRARLFGAPSVHVDYHGLRVIAPHAPTPEQVARQFDELAALADALR
jgi:hypothetical protein